MRKLIAIAVAIAFVSVLGVPAVLAGNNGQAGKSNTAHLYLYQKYLALDGKWAVYPGGAWGKMTYSMSGTDLNFVMNGHDLAPETDYTLIYYPDPWPGNGLMCLGTGTTDADGDVTIEGMTDTGDLPAPYDMNAYASTTTYYDGSTGAKIWLVLSSDVDCGARMMTAWTTTAVPEGNLVPYLFDSALIKFDDTDYNVAMLNLADKYSGSGASGKLTYNLAGPTFDFAFDAQGLVPGNVYTLVYFKDFGDPWNYYPVTKLASGAACSDGTLHLAVSVDLGMDLVDSGCPTDGVDGAKIWLVTSSDIGVSGILSWPPSLWLWEDHGIFYDDTDV